MKKYLPVLRNSPFFKGLSDNEILSILHCVNATVISKERASYIFRAGDSTEVMGLVVSGCVLVMQEDLWVNEDRSRKSPCTIRQNRTVKNLRYSDSWQLLLIPDKNVLRIRK